MSLLAWLGLGPLLIVTALAEDADRIPTLRYHVDVSLVLLNVVVTDGERYVEGLGRDDFRIYEDGQPREVSYFAWEGPEVDELEAAVPDGTNDAVRYVRRIRGRSDRVVFIIFDPVASLGNYRRGRDGARAFIERFAFAEDRVGLVFFSDYWSPTVIEPTLDREALIREIQRPRVSGFYDELGRDGARSIYRLLKGLIEGVQDAPGRKIFVLVSEGLPLVEEKDQRWLFTELTDTVDEANQKDITIYAVDPTGISAPGPGGAVRSAFLATAGSADLARRTGGMSLTHHNRLELAFERIHRDTTYYYTLGFTPPADEGAARWRKLKVVVDGHPEYEVRARTGYFAGG
jgi:VWFA-related protein